jgi:hypothetical protein
VRALLAVQACLEYVRTVAMAQETASKGGPAPPPYATAAAPVVADVLRSARDSLPEQLRATVDAVCGVVPQTSASTGEVCTDCGGSACRGDMVAGGVVSISRRDQRPLIDRF